MRSGWRIAAFALPLALLAGCSHKQKNAVPPVAAVAPSRPAVQMAELIPAMPPLPAYERLRPVGLNTTIPPEPNPATAKAHPRHVQRHARVSEGTQQEGAKPAAAAPVPAQPENSEVASGQPSEMSPIGQLSTASGDTNTADRQTLTDQINTTENTLNGLRSLSSDEQKTAALVRTFIVKARQALKTDDLDGARNYSTKAKILLQELTKE